MEQEPEVKKVSDADKLLTGNRKRFLTDSDGEFLRIKQ